MPADRNQNKPNLPGFFANNSFSLSIIFAVLALITTFIISVSEISFNFKLVSFIGIIIFYAVAATAVDKSRASVTNAAQAEIVRELQNSEAGGAPEKIFSGEIEEKLLALEEANTIFSSSLKPADMFRLISNRIGELIPFSLAALYLASVDRKKIKISYAFGRRAAVLDDLEIAANEGVAGKAFESGEIKIDEELATEKSAFPLDALQNLASAIACPLIYEGSVYGVLGLYNEKKGIYTEETKLLLKAVSARISPLFISSITFENNLNNALNDPLTNLPNERALFMLLENQVAESQRFREQRPLTVLSLDIKDFAKLNNAYGHATGDRILSFAAKIIKEQLRQMDFLSRLAGDEFLAVLPTSSDKTTEMIVDRIKKAFVENPFFIAEQNKVYIELNFGQASFIKDGETAQDLMKIAAIKKREAKSPIKSTVLWFPKDYSN